MSTRPDGRSGGSGWYPYRAIGDRSETLDFHLSQKRTSKAAKRFLGKALSRSPHNRPSVISTDKTPPTTRRSPRCGARDGLRQPADIDRSNT